MTKSIVSTECLVLGGGLAGLACAAEISKRGSNLVLVESENELYQHTSSHNSEVIHSGIYYKSSSLKAKFCLEGNALLYQYCEDRNIKHKKIGKLIVLCKDEATENLERIYENGVKNKVPEISIINKKMIRDLEPNVEADLAIHCGSTGIIDSHTFSLSLQAEIEENGGHIITNAPFIKGKRNMNRWRIEIGGLSPCYVDCDYLINATGFNSINIGRQLGISDLKDPYYVLGHYYSYSGSSPFNRLIYPIPTAGGLGIHSTMDLYGKTRFGPDSELIEKYDYKFLDSNNRKKKFNDSIKKYFPKFNLEKLMPDYTGIRTRLAIKHSEADFSILSPKEHNIDGLINIAGYESPGLTASLAMARYVKGLI